MSQSLIKSFKSLLYTIPGSKEREQISDLLNKSVEFRLDDDLTKAISKTIRYYPSTLEHNLDFLSVPFPSTWIEWNAEARTPEGCIIEDNKIYPEKVGALLATHPDDSNGVITVVAWKDKNQKVDHSQAILSWHNASFEKMSKDARNFYGTGKDEIFARIMSLVQTSVPAGFTEEMEILHDANKDSKSLDAYHWDAHRNSSAETMFILTFLLMLQTEQTVLSKLQEDDEEIATYKCSLVDTLKKPLFRKPKGFYRKKGLQGTKLQWHNFTPPET